MSGIVGIAGTSEVNQLLYDALLILQHRGQEAAGIVTAEGHTFHMHKSNGYVRDVFHTREMRSLRGAMGIGHVQNRVAADPDLSVQVQPAYVNSPFGMVLAVDGNFTNAKALERELFAQDLRHLNSSSHAELLLNVLAHELQENVSNCRPDPSSIFAAVAGVHRRCRGAYAAAVTIAGYGLLAFRDPYGIRPLTIGRLDDGQGTHYLIASESAAIDVLGFQPLRDVAPGEAVLIDEAGDFYSRQCAATTMRAPCIFEYVYQARPDSVLEGISVYEARLQMGRHLAQKIRTQLSHLDIDAVIPIPEAARPSAMQMASDLGLRYREGFIKNRYVGRTFVLPGQPTRGRSVRQELNATSIEFKNKNVLLVDDSILRGVTSREIIQMARENGAHKVYFASAAPPVRFPNVYGFDTPPRSELIAADHDEKRIAREIGADALIYQDLDALICAVQQSNRALGQFETSCFDGHYIVAV